MKTRSVCRCLLPGTYSRRSCGSMKSNHGLSHMRTRRESTASQPCRPAAAIVSVTPGRTCGSRAGTDLSRPQNVGSADRLPDFWMCTIKILFAPEVIREIHASRVLKGLISERLVRVGSAARENGMSMTVGLRKPGRGRLRRRARAGLDNCGIGVSYDFGRTERHDCAPTVCGGRAHSAVSVPAI